MDIQKEKIKQEFWNWAKVENPRMVENAELGDVYAIQNLDHMFMGFAAAKSQAVPEGFVLVLKEPSREFKDRLRSYLDNLWMGEWGCDWDGFICVNGIDSNEIWQFMIEAAQEPAND